MSSSSTFLVTVWILTLGAISIQDPHMVLVPEGVPLYQGQSVHIDCTVRDSAFLSWSSSEYVGTEPVVVRANSPRITTAMGAVISVLSASEGMIMSRLEFNITACAHTSSVTCRNIDHGREDSIYITSRGNATVLRIASKQEKFCNGDEVEVECTAQSSSFIEWIVDGQSVSQCRSPEFSQADATQTTCHLSIRIYKGLNRVTCRNVEIGVSDTIEIRVADLCQCSAMDTTLAIIVSSVVTLILSSFLCFSCGLLNGVAWQRISNRSRAALNQETDHTYNVIAPNTPVRSTALEMEQNVAYSTINASVQQ